MRMARVPPGSRFAVAVIAAVVVFAALGGGLAYRNEQNERDDRTDQVQQLASATAMNASRFVADRLALLNSIALSPSVRAGDRAAMRDYFASLDTESFAGDIFWVDAQGYTRVSSATPPDRLPVDLRDREYVQAVMANPKPHVGNAVVSKTLGVPIVPIAVPTFDEQGAFTGILVGTLRLDRLDVATKEQRFGTSELVIVDRAGNIIVRPDPVTTLENVAGSPLLERAMGGAGLLTDTPNLDGQRERTIGYAMAPDIGWTVLIDRSDDELFGSMRRTFRLEVAAILGTLLLVSLAALLVGRRINRVAAREAAALGELSLREARLRALTDATTSVTWTVDADGKLRDPHVRWSALTGLPPDQLDTTSWLPYVHPEDRVPGNRAWWAGIRAKSMIEFEQRVLRPDGDERCYLVRAVPVFEADGTVREWIGIDVDETERKNREAFEQAFVANVAHDVKNPLAAVKAQVQLLRRRIRAGKADVEAVDEVLALLDTGLARMNSQIEELADVARLRAGAALELRRLPTDLVPLVRDIVDSYRQTTDRHSIELLVDAEPLVGAWDAGRIDRVVDNLVSNAIKYSPAGGTVEVRLNRVSGDEDGDWATLTVTDHGIGIPAADLPHVCERYRRAQNTTVITGSGIGLAGARQIVEQHGGRIEIASDEGAGSRFTVSLPLGGAES